MNVTRLLPKTRGGWLTVVLLVIVPWLPPIRPAIPTVTDMLAGDSRQLVDTRVLNDPRVTNFYDPKRAVGSWFSEHLDREKGIAWDAYFLYGSDASWTTEPAPLLSSGRPVIGSSADLASAFRKLV